MWYIQEEKSDVKWKKVSNGVLDENRSTLMGKGAEIPNRKTAQVGFLKMA